MTTDVRDYEDLVEHGDPAEAVAYAEQCQCDFMEAVVAAPDMTTEQKVLWLLTALVERFAAVERSLAELRDCLRGEEAAG